MTFVDKSTGLQRSIPLNLLKFAAGGAAPSAAGWPGYAGYSAAAKAQLDAWLGELADEDVLQPAAAPPSPPAFRIAARENGATGDGLMLTITKVVPDAATPAQTKVDAALQTTQTYVGLTLATLAATLGRKTPALTGTRPGLVYLDGDPAALPATFEGDLAGATPKLDAPRFGGGCPAFTLLATRAGADGKLVHVKIGQVDQAAGTFTLTASWTKAATAVALADLQAQFAYLLTVQPPDGGFAAPPATGQVKLSGGSPTAPAAAAVLSS